MWIDNLSKAAGVLAAAMIVPAIGISAYEVVARYAFNSPTQWVNPTTTALCAMTFVLAGPYVLHKREFIRVTFLYDKFGKRAKRLVDVVSIIMTVLWAAALTYASWLQASGSIWRFRAGEWKPETLGSAWDVPIPALIRGVLFLSCALLLLQSLVELVRTLRRLEAVVHAD